MLTAGADLSIENESEVKKAIVRQVFWSLEK